MKCLKCGVNEATVYCGACVQAITEAKIKHGPGGLGGPGPSDPGCDRCYRDRNVKTLEPTAEARAIASIDYSKFADDYRSLSHGHDQSFAFGSYGQFSAGLTHALASAYPCSRQRCHQGGLRVVTAMLGHVRATIVSAIDRGLTVEQAAHELALTTPWSHSDCVEIMRVPIDTGQRDYIDEAWVHIMALVSGDRSAEYRAAVRSMIVGHSYDRAIVDEPRIIEVLPGHMMSSIAAVAASGEWTEISRESVTFTPAPAKPIANNPRGAASRPGARNPGSKPAPHVPRWARKRER